MLRIFHGRGAGVAASIAFLALGLTGCGAQEEALTAPTRSQTGSGLDVSPGLDRQSGAIIFPHERFTLSLKEQDILNAALTYSMRECVTSQGISYSPVSGGWDPIYDASNYFGVWTTTMAERFAFVNPMTQADMRANGVTINGVPIPDSTAPPPAWASNNFNSDEALTAIDGCLTLPESARFDSLQFTPGPWAAEFGNVSDRAPQTQEWKDAVGEYRQCLLDKGIEPDPEGELGVVGQNSGTIDAEQISLALEVVACKDQVKLVERLAGQIAAFQAPIIDEYATDLVAYRAQLDAVVAEAREYLATQGVSE